MPRNPRFQIFVSMWHTRIHRLPPLFNIVFSSGAVVIQALRYYPYISESELNSRQSIPMETSQQLFVEKTMNAFQF